MESNISSLGGKRVLITGGLGFIGSNLVHECIRLGAHVTIFDNLDPRQGGNHANIAEIRPSVRLAFHDMLDFDQVCSHVVDQDLIINCAASTSHPFSMREPWLDLDVNSRGTVNLLEAVRRFNPTVKLVHLGTSTQLGPLQYTPADERHPEYPLDIYSANKSVSEKYVLIYARSYGIRATVLRLPNVYGPRAAIHSQEFTFNNFFIGLALLGKTLTVYGDGAQRRNILAVDDAVTAILTAATTPAVDGRAWFAVGDEHPTVAEIAAETTRVIGRGAVAFVPWPVDRQRLEMGDAVFSHAAFTIAVGWRPTVNLAEGLRRTHEYFLPRLSAYFK